MHHRPNVSVGLFGYLPGCKPHRLARSPGASVAEERTHVLSSTSDCVALDTRRDSHRQPRDQDFWWR
jgi:hypothetical protein